MSNIGLTGGQRRFIDDLAALLTPWGMPQASARLYGYLLLSDDPVSLDQIAADLEISKSSACVAARLLEKHGNARRYGERGSKRVLYGPPDNYAGPLSEKSFLLGSLGKLLQSRAETVASDAAALRIKDMAAFYLSMRDAMDAAIQKQEARAATKKKRAG